MDQKSMTNLFSSYSSLSSLTNTTLIPVVDSVTGQNRKITGTQIKDYITRSAVAGATGAQGATGPIGATGPYGPIIPATTSTLGAITVGHNLTITTSGVLTSILSVVGDTPPTSPALGDQWWDSQAARGYVYYNGQWVEMSPNLSGGGTAALLVHTGPTPPLSSTLWYDTESGRTYVYYGTSWVDANPTVNYVLQPASTSTLGGVIVDGNTIIVDGNGVISASGSAAVDWSAVPSSIVPTDDLTYDLGSIDKQWRSLYVGTATIYIGGVPLTLNTASNTLVIGTSTNNTSTTALATEQFVIEYITTSTGNSLVNSGNVAQLDSSGNFVLPTNGYIIQHNSYTRTVTGNAFSTTPVVIWTGKTTGITSVKMTIQIEGYETGDSSGWHTQACEAIIADRWFANAGAIDPQMSVYGVIHTSVAPLATFTVQRNPTSHLIEVVATPSGTVNGTLYPTVHSVELGTRD